MAAPPPRRPPARRQRPARCRGPSPHSPAHQGGPPRPPAQPAAGEGLRVAPTEPPLPSPPRPASQASAPHLRRPTESGKRLPNRRRLRAGPRPISAARRMPVGPRRLPGYPPPLWTSTAGRSRRDPGYQPNPREGRGSDSLEEHTLWPADDRRGRAGGSPLTLASCPCCLTLRGGHLLHPATPPEVTP
ncbi:formin-like protein 14 [Prionailurus bengalensis]|uniref:formin-like protein 14 n=1 Tax=Prionailurus bengalensis TaxID=37029 RepID=UPI001CA83E0D|nr:formin-like protein 14 [Prionailurus bengalensis]